MGKIGIIGGSGLYDIEGIRDVKSEKVSTPFGEPSDEYTVGKLEGKEVVFLPRHGKGHKILPTELNFRANIYGMKKLGADRIISLTAVGSLKEELKPLDMVIIDQFVDRTNQARKTTFFGDGIAGHIAFCDPICPELADLLYKAAKSVSTSVHKGGTYLNMEGPAFSTKAESKLYRSWGMDVIGMTEAEICYSTVAMVTDYDCWYEGEESVTIEMIIENLQKNAKNAKDILKKVLPEIPEDRNCVCATASKFAVLTKSHLIPEKIKKNLDIIIGKYIK